MYYVTAHRRRYVQRALLRKRGHVVQQLLHRAQQVLRAAVGAADLAVAHQQTQLQEQRVDALLARRRRRVEGRRRQVARGGRREERVGEEAVQQLLGFAGFGGVGGVGGILSSTSNTLRCIGNTLRCIRNTLRCISNTLRCISNTLCTLLRSILHITRCHCTQSLSLLLSLGCFLRLLRSTQRLLLLLCQILVRFLLRSDFYTHTIHSCAPSFVISCVMAGSGWFISTHQCDCLSEPVTASCCSFSAFLACTDAAFAAFFALRSACFSSCVKFLFASCCARIAKRDTEVPFLTLLLRRLGINATFLRNLHSDAFDEWKVFP